MTRSSAITPDEYRERREILTGSEQNPPRER
jgi:hypothetical protein